ncbi:aspartate aminotransferase family protein [Viridibacillus arvi]|uniref:aminotransferase family protein n=1 Tax=Viridibacillus arvi TaxID=263475 RepID=UPI003D05AF8F
MTTLNEWDKKHFIHPTSSIQEQQANGPKVIFDKSEGIYLTSKDGTKYIDAMSSLWNVNIGHGRKEIAEAAKEQMEQLAYSSCFSNFSNEPAIRLAKKIASLAPPSLNAVFFTSGGSESNDSAIKIVRHYWRIQGQPERNKIVALQRGYHGVSAGATSATGIPEFWDMAGNLMQGFVHAKSPYEIGTEASIQSIREVIEAEGPEKIAAFMAEPVQGAGGVLIPPKDYYKAVRKICNEYGILYIADEVITGFGRTGKMFGVENYGVEPDVLTFAKGVTSGYFPLGGVIVSDHVHNVLKEKSEGVLFHGFTYSGHPTGAAVALKNLEILERENLVDNSFKMGEELQKGFKSIKEESTIVGDIRTLGLLGAMEFVQDPLTNKRFPAELKVAPRIIAALHERGVICRAVTYDNTDIVCFSPPLIITKAQIDDLVAILREAVLIVQQEVEEQLAAL